MVNSTLAISTFSFLSKRTWTEPSRFVPGVMPTAFSARSGSSSEETKSGSKLKSEFCVSVISISRVNNLDILWLARFIKVNYDVMVAWQHISVWQMRKKGSWWSGSLQLDSTSWMGWTMGISRDHIIVIVTLLNAPVWKMTRRLLRNGCKVKRIPKQDKVYHFLFL